MIALTTAPGMAIPAGKPRWEALAVAGAGSLALARCWRRPAVEGGWRLFRVVLVSAVFLVVLIFIVDLVVLGFENQIEVERIFAMRVDHVLLPIAAREIDRVRVIQIVTNLDPKVTVITAVAERVRVDDTAVNGFDVNFVRHERQSSIGAGEVEGV
jgi:hypothetical protein